MRLLYRKTNMVERERLTERHPLSIKREGAEESAGASQVHNGEKGERAGKRERGVVITAVYPDRIS